MGTLCLLDTKPRYDFDEEKTRQLEDLAAVTVHQFEVRYLKLQNEKLLNQKRKLQEELIANKQLPPEKNVTYLFTDIQGSTELWEKYPNEMNEALKFHDEQFRAVLNECYGYEVNTEGDAFHAVSRKLKGF